MLKYNLRMTMEVDLPTMPQNLIDKILEWHDSRKVLLDNIGAKGINYPWIASHIRDDTGIDSPIKIPFTKPGSPWNHEFIKLFPEAVKHFECLPLSNIERIVLLEPKKRVAVHVDRSKTHCPDNKLEPASYRMYLRHSNKSHGFYVQPKPMKEWGNYRAIIPTSPGYLDVPPLPFRLWKADPGQWWLLGNFCSQHGADWNEGDNKVIISVQGRVDDVMHKELVDKSMHMRCLKHDALLAAEKGTPEEYTKFIESLNDINEWSDTSL